MSQEDATRFELKTLVPRRARQARSITVQRDQYRRRALGSACRELRDLDEEWSLADLDGRLKIIDRQVKLWEAQRILCGESLPRSTGARPLIEMPRPQIRLAEFTTKPAGAAEDGLLLDSFPDAESASPSVSTVKPDVLSLSEREGIPEPKSSLV